MENWLVLTMQSRFFHVFSFSIIEYRGMRRPSLMMQRRKHFFAMSSSGFVVLRGMNKITIVMILKPLKKVCHCVLFTMMLTIIVG